MSGDLLHRAALDALLTEATRPALATSRARLAATCGFSPSTLSMAVSGSRPLPATALSALLDCTGWNREALMLPYRARPGDVEARRIVAELRRRREQDERWQREMLAALNERNGG